MAIKKGRFIIGSIGTAVFKVFKGVQILQSAPGKGGVRQTRATKRSAGLFGKSSGLAGNIRSALGSVINDLYDGTMVYRMTTAISAIVRHSYELETNTYHFKSDSFDSLVGFDFNVNSPLRKSLWSVPQSQLSANVLTVTLPEIQIPGELEFPKGTDKCILKISIGIFNLGEGSYYKSPNFRQVEVNLKQGVLEKQEFEFQIPAGCLCVAGIALDYYTVRGNLGIAENSKAFNPSAIFAAFFNAGTFTPEDPLKWRSNDKAVLR